MPWPYRGSSGVGGVAVYRRADRPTRDGVYCAAGDI